MTDPKNETPETDALYKRHHPAQAMPDMNQSYAAFVEHARSLERRLRGAEAALIEATHNKELAENRERLTQERAEAAERGKEGMVIGADEVLVAIKRPEGYEDMHPDLLAHDCFRDFVEYRLLAAERGAELAPGTIRNRLAYLKAACRYAWKHHNLVDADPTSRMHVPPANNERQVYLRLPELARLVRACRDPEVRAIIRIAFYTGLRWISELLPLTPASIKRRAAKIAKGGDAGR